MYGSAVRESPIDLATVDCSSKYCRKVYEKLLAVHQRVEQFQIVLCVPYAIGFHEMELLTSVIAKVVLFLASSFKMWVCFVICVLSLLLNMDI